MVFQPRNKIRELLNSIVVYSSTLNFASFQFLLFETLASIIFDYISRNRGFRKSINICWLQAFNI